ncbi:hypothetical protein IWQ60_012441 [Tieghemiomyces parasiticus]|uniref:CCHC-type domain-containing protein n=1 Tax=Tieghemiomyces parasiticus TaxID=78921 RepID=A0A9W7ZLE5_9FUNG|nr:hypothetical protein IWQ60_012441 [Tieghemiomyces parasiticus]
MKLTLTQSLSVLSLVAALMSQVTVAQPLSTSGALAAEAGTQIDQHLYRRMNGPSAPNSPRPGPICSSCGGSGHTADECLR